MSTVTDPVPSTYDVPLTHEREVDEVLTTLRNARDRYEKDGIDGSYYRSSTGEGCAIGLFYVTSIGYQGPKGNLPWAVDAEKHITKTAKEAIMLLDKVAKENYPRYVKRWHRVSGKYLGSAIEGVNEVSLVDDDREFLRFSARKQRVLKCYDQAIALRKAM